jgi:hypothetical protein
VSDFWSSRSDGMETGNPVNSHDAEALDTPGRSRSRESQAPAHVARLDRMRRRLSVVSVLSAQEAAANLGSSERVRSSTSSELPRLSWAKVPSAPRW